MTSLDSVLAERLSIKKAESYYLDPTQKMLTLNVNSEVNLYLPFPAMI